MRAGCAPGGPGGGAANVRLVLHAIGGVISAAVVLAAFWAAVRLLAGRAFRRAAYPRRLLGPRRRGAVTLRLARAAGRVLLLAVRFAAGAPLGRRRTDATFLSRGTHAVGGVPGWFTTGQPGRWAFLPGWQRAAVRWAAVAAAVGLYARPLITAAVLGAAAVAGRGGAGPPLAAGAVRAGRGPPGLPPAVRLPRHRPGREPARWLDVPRGFAASPDAVVTLTYPAAWNPDAAKQKNIDEVIRRHLGGDLAGTFGPHTATWRHPPAPPARALFDGYTLPAHRIHLATLPGGRKWIADLENEEPHLFIAAGTGGGKTATAALAAAHARAHGWLIDIIDPKRRSYIDRKTGARRPHQRARHPRAHRHRSDDVGAGRVLPVHARRQHRRRLPRRLARRVPAADAGHRRVRHLRRDGRPHPPPQRAAPGRCPRWTSGRQIEWQGRVAGHRLLVAVHQPNLRLFADSDSRASYGYRLITGAYTASLWRMTFGYAPPIEWDARIKGRGVVGIGEASSLIHHAQIAWLPAAERRRYALTGPPPPDWHADMRPAPWITPRVLAEGRKLAGASLVTIPASPVPALAAVPVPPGQHAPPPAETPSGVPPRDTPAAQAEAPADQVTRRRGRPDHRDRRRRRVPRL